MCRNIRTLFHFDPPASQDEIQAAALQFVRKVSGSTRPSKANQAVFDEAVHEISECVEKLLNRLKTQGPARNREVEAAKARAKAALRYPDSKAATSQAGQPEQGLRPK
ncbi:MAG: DUF2277 domain-containing protein [Vulcanimicrobiota bacterium]